MKTTLLYLLLLTFVSCIYSYKISKSDTISFPEIESSNKYFDEETGFPDVEVVNGPIHYENNDEYIDVFGTIDNYIKSYLQNIEYRITDHFHRFGNSVFVDMIQQYNGVDIDGTYLRFVLDCVNGKFEKVTANILKPNFSGDAFENENVSVVLENFNKNYFASVLNLSSISYNKGIDYNETNELGYERVPFANSIVKIKKAYLIINSTTVQPTWRLRFNYVYSNKIKSNKNIDYYDGDSYETTLYLNDKNGEITVGSKFNYNEEDIEKFKQKYGKSTSKVIPISTTSTTTTKQIPISTTSTTTTTTKQIPISTTSTTTTTTKQIPISTTTTTTTKQIPISTTSTTTTTTKQIPISTTSTTTTTTKQIPISTTSTTTKQVPTSTNKILCENVTVTKTETEFITIKEIVTVTVKNYATNNVENCVSKWGQCGGQGYNGPTCCQSGFTCQEVNQWYSQCI